MKIGYSTITWGGVVGHPAGVTSVKDLFYRTNGNTLDALGDISSVGYQGTELFDGNLAEFQDRPDVLLGALKLAKLELVSVYTGANFIYDEILEDELHKISQAAKLASEFGASRLVVGGGAKRASGEQPQDMAKLAKALDKVVDIAASFGLECSYHPHLGTIVETPEALERLIALSKIKFCPDTAHLTAGGGNPVELIEKYGDRLAHVHLKDYKYATGEFLPLGRGDIDFPNVLAAVQASGYNSWLLVELDSYDGDPKEAAEISKRYLESLLTTQ
ncbi:MAG: sugar phosphate isomerase/epimerase family protein [Actinomycetota bacterium]